MGATGDFGTHKLIVIKNRFGPTTSYGEYINMKVDGSTSKIIEGKLSSDKSPLPEPKKESAFEVEKDDNAPIRFSA
jgi:hypothetical protein